MNARTWRRFARARRSRAAGRRAVEAFIGHAQRLHDHLGRGRHTLVAYIDDVPTACIAAFDAAVDAWRAALGAAASAVLIVSPKVANAASSSLHVKLSNALRQRRRIRRFFGAKQGMAWAIRPDGHIGYRSASCSSGTLIAWLDRVLGRDITR